MMECSSCKSSSHSTVEFIKVQFILHPRELSLFGSKRLRGWLLARSQSESVSWGQLLIGSCSCMFPKLRLERYTEI